MAKNPWFVCRVFEQIDAREPGHFHLGPQCILQCRKVARCSSVAALFAAKGLNLKACSGNYSTIFHIHVSLCNVDWFFNVFFYHTFEICVCSATSAGGFLYTIPKHVQMPRCQGSSKCVVRNPQLFSSAGCDLLQCSHWCMWPFWTLA